VFPCYLYGPVWVFESFYDSLSLFMGSCIFCETFDGWMLMGRVDIIRKGMIRGEDISIF
jgi:hypothetical protein